MSSERPSVKRNRPATKTRKRPLARSSPAGGMSNPFVFSTRGGAMGAGSLSTGFLSHLSESDPIDSCNSCGVDTTADSLSGCSYDEEPIQPAGNRHDRLWETLRSSVIGKPIAMRVFQRDMMTGNIHKHYRRSELNKLMTALKTILEDHGEFKLAATIDMGCRMPELANSGASALRSFLSSTRTARTDARWHNGVKSAVVPSPPASILRASEPLEGERPNSPLVSRSNDARVESCPLVCNVPRAVNETRVARHTHPEDSLLVKLVNEVSSPLHRVLCVVLRTQLCFGNVSLPFEIPRPYLEGVASRRIRVHAVPFQPPFVPMPWPTPREIDVRVNGRSVVTSWRRRWPERLRGVAKTVLPLDITQFLNRSCCPQELGIVVHSTEYTSQMALLIVQLVPLEEVMNSIIAPLHHSRDMLDADMYAMYRRVLEDEDGSRDEVEMANLAITTKCPISQTRITVPIRGACCSHLQCFDCRSFLMGCHIGCYWNCPICDSQLRPDDIRVDTVLMRYIEEADEKCAVYLQLECNRRGGTNGDETVDGARETADAVPFRWVPKRSGCDVVDVLVDGDDDDSDDATRPRRHALAYGGVRVPFLDVTELGDVISDNEDMFPAYRTREIGRPTERCRRNASHSAGAGGSLCIGTAECPIVL